jgi:hypothetical protein
MYDPTDERGVPSSAGIPAIVMWSGVAGIVLVFIVAALVLGTAGNNHLWPAANTLRLKL